MVAEAERRQRLAAGSELPVGHVVPGVDQFDQSSLPTSCQNAAVLSRGPASPGHQHRGPGQGEELLSRGSRYKQLQTNKLKLGCEYSVSSIHTQHFPNIRSSRLHHHSLSRPPQNQYWLQLQFEILKSIYVVC